MALSISIVEKLKNEKWTDFSTENIEKGTY
jgi:hypothetical protein